MARLRSGDAGLQLARIREIRPKWFSTSFGLKLGEDIITRTRPVRGSSATTAPQLSPSASSAVFWPLRSSVVTTVSPTIGCPLSLSSDWSTREERLRTEPVRIGFKDRSRPARERPAVE